MSEPHGSTSESVLVRWYRAVDMPVREQTPFRKEATTSPNAKTPTTWVPFSLRDSKAIEDVYHVWTRWVDGGKLGLEPGKLAAVNEDYLFEVNVDKKELYPIYWDGPVYSIKRGFWFYAVDSSRFYPCDENLTKQIEAGYKKFQPLKITPMPSTPVLSNTVELTAAGEAASVHPINPDATRWPLFGPHLNQFVIFAGDSHAWLLNDMITSKLTRTLMTKLTNGENLGGTKLLRGYPEVLRTTSKAKKAVDQKKKVASKPDLDIKEKPVDVSATERMTKDVEPETLRKLQEREQVEDYVDDDDPLGSPDRKLDHLVFVIHGIGQKLSARTDVVNFVHDVNLLRRNMKTCAGQYFPPTTTSVLYNTPTQSNRSTMAPGQINLDVPEGSGVQVLPIQWRHQISFEKRQNRGEEDEDEYPTLDDVTLEAVPGIRNLANDLVLDVLLFMAPTHRQGILNVVCREMNRQYKIFMARNPNFTGKVSILGHSLGSLVIFDLLCNQDKATDNYEKPALVTPGNEMDLSNFGKTSAFDNVGREEEIRYGKLKFEVETFFAMGSPLGLFMLLQNKRLMPRTNNFSALSDRQLSIVRPKCKNLYNIFHPYDPVSYRLEPFVVTRRMAKLKPVSIPWCQGGLKGSILVIQDGVTDLADKGRYLVSSMFEGVSGVMAAWSIKRTIERTEILAHAASEPDKNAVIKEEKVALEAKIVEQVEGEGPSATDSKTKIPRSGTAESLSLLESIPVEVFELNKTGRIDYELQSGIMPDPFAALRVHMQYWESNDVACFLIRELYS